MRDEDAGTVEKRYCGRCRSRTRHVVLRRHAYCERCEKDQIPHIRVERKVDDVDRTPPTPDLSEESDAPDSEGDESRESGEPSSETDAS